MAKIGQNEPKSIENSDNAVRLIPYPLT